MRPPKGLIPICAPCKNARTGAKTVVLDVLYDDALAVFRYNTELYPESANVFDSLGEALERAGRLKEALANYSRAVDNASTLGDQRLAVFTANRDRVKEQIEQAKGD